MKKLFSTLAIALLILSMMFVPFLASAEGATIWTDKPDYNPCETVIISGSGFLSNAEVTITITRPDLIVDTISVLTEESGAFSCSYQLDGIAGTYAVTATDGASTATTTFTDRIWSVSVSPTSATVPQGGSTTATVTVTASPTGGPELDLWATDQPTGVTVSFSPTKGKPYFTSTMSISVGLTTTPGTYPIAICVFTGLPGQPSYSEKVRTTFTLTVTAIPPATVSITITSSPVTGSDFVKVDDNPITTAKTFTWTIGSAHKLEALSPVAGPTDTQYVWTSWSDFGAQTHDYTVPSSPQTVTANYKTQYYLTVVSPYDTPGGMGWYSSNAAAYATLATGTVDITPGWVRAIFIGWSGDASGSGLTSDPITMNGPKTAIADWEIQYYLDVVTDPSNLPPIPGAEWYSNCTWVTLTASQYVPNATGVNSVRYRFSYWDVDGTSQGIGVNPIDIHMNASHTATAYYVTQFYLTLATSPPGVDAPTGAGWYDALTYASISTAQYVDIVLGSSRYCFNGWTTADMSEITDSSATSTTILMDKAKTVTANYVTQYNVTFDQTGVGSDFTGTVVIIDGSNYGVGTLPVSLWYDNGSTPNFAFQSPLVVPPGAKQYDWASTTGLSSLQWGTITVTGPGSITGNYVTHVHDVAVTNIVASTPHCASKVGNDLWVFQGLPVYVNVTVLNKGDFSDIVAVTLYYNITDNKIIGIQSITIPVGESRTLSFVWDTGIVPYCHNYTITAVAAIPADFTSADNTLDNVYIKVRILGDLNGDGKVSGLDVALAAWSFASYGPDFLHPGSPPHPRWNLDCDINGNNKIDGTDVALVARNFGMCAS